MIGNDIVDLTLAKTQSNWQRKGFLEKQFTQKEQEIILKSDASFLCVWLFWSMKEAAYKCYTQKHLKRFFAPQKFECTLVSKDEGVVTFENHQFYTTTFFSSSYVSTIAQKSQENVPFFSVIGSPKTVDKDIKLKLSEVTGFVSEQITQQKSTIGAPLYYHKEKLLTKSCSISHHGNYGAFAFILENES
ncbi:4'-phosphopantetheinyl transferase superfamily protein [uncultured Polaribacter sp.]|uniref:4'-phosphopantetheinyl transferase family protein n=1 Tax=uncultured Polaribacter sp. TaxID=174711 RepID=UPI002631004D|nr:4'-phosphopantetheinyl transferase superfamily protein [uncultured Polaribacter sp.]